MTMVIVLSGQDPYCGSPHAIPGRIEMEESDEGGEGIAYHDIDTIDRGVMYEQMKGLMPQVPSGWTSFAGVNGEWLEYTVEILRALRCS